MNPIHLDYRDGNIPTIPCKTLFKQGNIFVNKSRRFSYTPAHRHNFIEFNYMYSGHCTQYINDEKIVLNQNDLILMDKDIVQRIDSIGPNDILINIGVRDVSIFNNITHNLADSESLVTKFMLNAAIVNAVHNNFILFNVGQNEMANELIKMMIVKSLSKNQDRNKSLNLLLSTLLIELANTVESQTNQIAKSADPELAILQYIDTHYSDLSLKTLAKHFGYNKNYLGNMLKKTTGQTFQSLLDQKRLARSRTLLTNTNYSIENISEMIGFKSPTSLFKLYRKYLHTTPKTFRMQHQ
ncbi:transcription regulator [Lactobacillus selangorensis]|nr:transcription regulator [Lactobacillus selangorensis]